MKMMMSGSSFRLPRHVAFCQAICGLMYGPRLFAEEVLALRAVREGAVACGALVVFLRGVPDVVCRDDGRLQAYSRQVTILPSSLDCMDGHRGYDGSQSQG